MKWNTVALQDVPAQPWRNSGGVTRELLAWPAQGEWAVRISVAEVEQDGPFSSFPGIARWFAVLKGEGVSLTVDGVVHTLTARSDPLHFSGSAMTDCGLLDGATQDFNLMLRGRAGRMDRVVDSRVIACRAQGLVAVFANRSNATLRAQGEEMMLAPGTLAWCVTAADASVEIVGNDALSMEVAP